MWLSTSKREIARDVPDIRYFFMSGICRAWMSNSVYGQSKILGRILSGVFTLYHGLISGNFYHIYIICLDIKFSFRSTRYLCSDIRFFSNPVNVCPNIKFIFRLTRYLIQTIRYLLYQISLHSLNITDLTHFAP